MNRGQKAFIALILIFCAVCIVVSAWATPKPTSPAHAIHTPCSTMTDCRTNAAYLNGPAR
jgi:hypothetical protein